MDWLELKKSGKSIFIHGDCMDYLPSMPDKFAELGIVDPPYGRGEKIKNGGGWAKDRLSKFSFSWDKKPSEKYFNYLLLKSKNQIICGANNFTKSLEESNGWIIWDKITDGFTATVPELLWTSFDKSCKIFRFPHGEGRGFRNKDFGNIHPTEKPVALYRWLLHNYANPGDLIIDTHVGSASSLIACEQMGFQYVGFEIDKDYYDAATKRIKKAREKLKQSEIFKREEIEVKQEALF